jgi:anti-sigma factor ChrR (cupin superfamily)
MSLSIHADRSQLALVDGGALPWLASPERGVDRRMLERSGGEIAMATSIVRYDPGSRFPEHGHEQGEELLVLSGVFSDEGGDYPAGSYVRNPPGSRHAPFSVAGCVILVKLRQMRDDEPQLVRILPAHRCWRVQCTAGVERASLYSNPRIDVGLLRLAAGGLLPARRTRGGEEWFVVEGEIEIGGPPRTLAAWSWRRDARPRQPAIRSAGGALLWIKRGHL